MLKFTHRRPTRFIYAIAVQVASIIGIGFLAVPFVMSKAGFGVGLIYLVVMSGFIILTYLLYGEVILRTHYRHQLVGYVHKYLGGLARKISLFTFWVGVYGSTIGVLIVNGRFLSDALKMLNIQINPVVLSTLFFIVAVSLVYWGLRTVARVDFIIMFFVLLTVLLIFIVGLPAVRLENYSFSSGNLFFLPFGVILYSLYGVQGVPLVREVLAGQEHRLRKAIMWGVAIPTVIYLIFALTVVGVAGENVTPTAMDGLGQYLGPQVILVGLILGFLTSSTIFLSIATAFKESLTEDFHFRRRWHFIAFLLPALFLFLARVRDFIEIIGLVGGVSVSIEMILLLLVYVKCKHSGERLPEYSIRIPVPFIYLMMLLFGLGAVYTILL